MNKITMYIWVIQAMLAFFLAVIFFIEENVFISALCFINTGIALLCAVVESED